MVAAARSLRECNDTAAESSLPNAHPTFFGEAPGGGSYLAPLMSLVPAALRWATALSAALVYAAVARAQLVPYTPLAGEDGDVEELLIRDGGRSGIHAALRPHTFSDVAALVDYADSTEVPLNWAAAATLARAAIRLGRVEGGAPTDRRGLRGWLGRTFYRTRGYAVDVRRPGFRLLANPVLDLRTGRQSNNGGYNFLNTRGVRVRGQVDDRVYFQTAIYENQAGLRSYAQEWRRAYDNRVPGVGFYQDFEPLLYDLPEAVDYFQATGEVGFRLTRHIHARLGHGNPALGVGQRSAILGAFADPFFYAEIDTRIGRFHYRNLYAQLQDGVPLIDRVERKWLVAHTLSLQLTPAWEFGLTEQTVYKRGNGRFDVQYLNPVIVYRAIEQDNGSPDNTFIGFHSNLILGRTAMVYGQLLFDEFKVDELLLNGDQWWANKYSWQLGGRYVDALGLPGLTLVAEVNMVRPFTFAHRFEGISLTHYSQPLAHPWGASLREYRLGVRQWLTPRWQLRGSFVNMTQDDIAAPPAPHIGANVLYDNDLREREYGYSIAGTAAVSRTVARAQLLYLPFPGASVEAGYELYRRGAPDGTSVVQHGFHLGVSLNAWRREGLF